MSDTGKRHLGRQVASRCTVCPYEESPNLFCRKASENDISRLMYPRPKFFFQTDFWGECRIAAEPHSGTRILKRGCFRPDKMQPIHVSTTAVPTKQFSWTTNAIVLRLETPAQLPVACTQQLCWHLEQFVACWHVRRCTVDMLSNLVPVGKWEDVQ